MLNMKGVRPEENMGPQTRCYLLIPPLDSVAFAQGQRRRLCLPQPSSAQLLSIGRHRSATLAPFRPRDGK